MELSKENSSSFHLCILHKEYNYIKKWFKDNSEHYNVEEYVVSLEIAQNKHKQTNGEHFHIFIYAPSSKNIKKTATNIQKHFVEKYKLRGKAKDGIGRQYGACTLRDPDTMLMYCIKDNNELNIITKGLKEKSLSLSEWEDRKEDTKDWFFQLQEILADRNRFAIIEYDNYHTTSYPKTARTEICELILQIYLEKTMKPPTKSQMDAFIKYHQLHHLKLTTLELTKTWYYDDQYN